jgi:hypothetical protein
MNGTLRQPGALVLALCALLYATAAYAADAGMSDQAPVDATLTQSFSPEEPIQAGETVTLTLKIDHPAGASIELPDSYEPDRWVLVDADSAATGQEGRMSTTWVVTFGIYRPGETTLQSFDIRVVARDGAETTLATEPVQVKVLSRFADAESEPDFVEARPPVDVWVDDMTLAWVGGGLGFAALLGLLAFAAARREAMRPAPPPPPRAAHEVALEKLGALAGDDLVERGEYMIFWVRLSEAIRQYLGRTYGFAPTELTTAEILAELDSVYWPPGIDLEDVADFLRHCDRVKFAGHVPGVEESSKTLRRAFSIVELTRPGGSTATEESDSAEEKPAADPATTDDVEASAPTEVESQWAPPTEHGRAEEEE